MLNCLIILIIIVCIPKILAAVAYCCIVAGFAIFITVANFICIMDDAVVKCKNKYREIMLKCGR